MSKTASKATEPVVRDMAKEYFAALHKEPHLRTAEEQELVHPTPVSNEKRLEMAAAARAALSQRERDRRANAYPPILGKKVRADMCFWRYVDAVVIKDDGPPNRGDRIITIEKLRGSFPERGNIRRDRVRVVSE